MLGRENQNFHHQKNDIELMRYYNNAQLGLDLLYEAAEAGSVGAKIQLHHLSQVISRQAVTWKIFAENLNKSCLEGK